MHSERTFFVTTVTVQRLPIFRRVATARLLIETLAHYREQMKFQEVYADSAWKSRPFRAATRRTNSTAL